MGPYRENVLHRFARIASPATLGLALILFVLPFLSVSCDAPGGYGRAKAGGTTTYSGLALMTGGAPSVDDDKLRPDAEQQSDELPAQPLLALAALAIVGAIVIPLVSTARRRLAAMIGALGAVLIVVGMLVARATLVDRVAEQATVAFPAGKSAGDYVKVGIGFFIVTVLTIVGSALSALASRASPVNSP